MAFSSKRMTHTDGTMHHLGIDESHTAKKVILTPDPMAIPSLAYLLDGAVKTGDNREYVTFTGSFRGRPLSVMSCGFGCMPMAIAVEELWHLGVTDIIKIAACPAIQQEIAAGTVCIAQGAVRGEGASKEYIDASYPAVSDMQLLSVILERAGGDARVGIFRSHDCEEHESPYAPGGMDRIKYWSNLGVDILDGETSAMFVVSSILKIRAASIAVARENYLTRKYLTGEEIAGYMDDIFLLAAEALIC